MQSGRTPPSKNLVKTSGTGDEGEASVDEVVTVYCPNTGPMVGLLDKLPNARVQLSKSSNPKRKYAYTLEMIQIHNGDRNVWVGVHSSSANRMVEQALTSRWLTELGRYDSVRREVKFAKGSRVDFVLVTNAEDGSIAHEKYVEVKSVTLSVRGGGQATSRCAVFPDTVSTRAQKHVVELTELLLTNSKAQVDQESKRATPERSGAIIFLIQRDDCHAFAPSIEHDRKFAELCVTAASSGVQLLAYACALEPDELNGSGAVRLLKALPLHDGAVLDEVRS
uniref:Sugar fermentation stimulation protein homolog n=1 Tax=Hyaloperonospora arabidopsidis (strain Emoy2) TaxID=559515 RepID=M4C0N9_HYAAE